MIIRKREIISFQNRHPMEEPLSLKINKQIIIQKKKFKKILNKNQKNIEQKKKSKIK